MEKKLFFLCIVLLELAVIMFLAGKIYLEQSQVLGENISINPISKKDVVFPYPDSDSDLKYFNELVPNRIINKNPAWFPPDHSYIVTTNSDSLNERFDYTIEKDSDVFRIVAIGDSYTYGGTVNTEENYPERLEDMLNDNFTCKINRRYEVINLGVSGYDIEYAVHRFKLRGQKYNPDLVLWLIKNDDFALINEFTKPKKDQYKREMISDDDLYAKLRSEGDFFPWSRKVSQELIEEIGEEGVLAYNKKALERINEYYKGRLIFVSWPQSARVLNDSYFSMLQSFARERDDAYIFHGLEFPYDHFEDWHPTSKGYAQIAGEIFDYLTQNGLVPCDSP